MGSGAPSSAAPDHIDLLVHARLWANAYAGYGNSGKASGLTATASASAFGASVSADASGTPSASSDKRRLVRLDASGAGPFSFDLDGSTDQSVNNTLPYGEFGPYPGYPNSSGYFRTTNGQTSATSNAFIQAATRKDEREAAISSTLGQTFHKGTNNSRDLDAPDANGTIHANTVKPEIGTIFVIYYGHAYGAWAPNSQFKMHLSSQDVPGDSNTNNTTDGTFTLPDDPLCSLGMDYDNSATSEHAYLHLTDASDGAEATANYYATFHNAIEEWHRTATQDHPGDFKRMDGSTNPEWQRIVVVDNNSPAAGSVTLSTTYSDSVTQTGQIGGQASLGASGIAAFQANENITNGHTCTGTIAAGYQFAGAPWTKIEYYVAKTYEERWGTCDIYGADGFQQTANWYGVYATDPMVLSLHGETIRQYPH